MCKKISCDVYYIWEKNKLIKQLVFSKQKKKKEKEKEKKKKVVFEQDSNLFKNKKTKFELII